MGVEYRDNLIAISHLEALMKMNLHPEVVGLLKKALSILDLEIFPPDSASSDRANVDTIFFSRMKGWAVYALHDWLWEYEINVGRIEFRVMSRSRSGTGTPFINRETMHVLPYGAIFWAVTHGASNEQKEQLMDKYCKGCPASANESNDYDHCSIGDDGVKDISICKVTQFRELWNAANREVELMERIVCSIEDFILKECTNELFNIMLYGVSLKNYRGIRTCPPIVADAIRREYLIPREDMIREAAEIQRIKNQIKII